MIRPLRSCWTWYSLDGCNGDKDYTQDFTNRISFGHCLVETQWVALVEFAAEQLFGIGENRVARVETDSGSRLHVDRETLRIRYLYVDGVGRVTEQDALDVERQPSGVTDGVLFPAARRHQQPAARSHQPFVSGAPAR